MQDERTDADKLKQKGNECYRNKRYLEAIDYYTQAIEIKSDATFFANRAACFFYTQKYRKSISDCRQALLLNPEYKKAYLRKGSAELAVGEIEDALNTFLEGAKVDPSDKGIQNELTKAKKVKSYYEEFERYDNEKEYQIALRKADAILEHCPGFTKIVIKKLLLAAKMGEFEEGVKLIKANQQKLSSNPDFIYAAGLVYMYKGSSNHAIKMWRDGNSMAPDNTKCRDAVKRFKKQERIKKEATDLFKAKDYQNAYNKYKEAFDEDPDNRHFNSVLKANMGTCLMKLGKKKPALSEFHEAVSLNPTNGKAYMKRGNCQKELEE